MSSAIAAQLYTLRQFTKTPAEVASTLAKVRKIGFEAVQVSGMGPIDPRELAKMLDGEGLRCVVTHISLDRMRDEAQAVIEEHRLWKCAYTAIGSFHADSAEQWVDFARQYNEVAKLYEGSGVSIGYHNHSHEFARHDGKTAMQLLAENLNPGVWFEIDTYWVAHAGGDPAACIEQFPQRVPCVHLKDMAITPKREQYMAEVGVGNLNWPRILEACRKVGVEWYIIEQDRCYRDPFDSLATSFENLRGMGIQ